MPCSSRVISEMLPEILIMEVWFSWFYNSFPILIQFGVFGRMWKSVSLVLDQWLLIFLRHTATAMMNLSSCLKPQIAGLLVFNSPSINFMHLKNSKPEQLFCFGLLRLLGAFCVFIHQQFRKILANLASFWYFSFIYRLWPLRLRYTSLVKCLQKGYTRRKLGCCILER